MDSAYLYCAAIGGTLLLLQTLLSFLGGDGGLDAEVTPDSGISSDSDATGETPGRSPFTQLSLRTAVAFTTFFGLAGLASREAEFSHYVSAWIAFGAGTLAFFAVGYLMFLMTNLNSRGNLDLNDAIGASAKVYLRIPAANAGVGKITLVVGGRQITRKAITRGDALPTGSPVRVRALAAADTLEVTSPPDYL